MNSNCNTEGNDYLHPDLCIAKQLIYDACHFQFAMLQQGIESREYAACTLQVNGHTIVFRCGKITPTKTGHFVAIWRRNNLHKTVPFCDDDAIDFFIISCRNGNKLGQFIFPLHVLIQQKIVSTKNQDGKRGIRVYPPWDIVSSRQAQQTQSWQKHFFLPIEKGDTHQLLLAQRLLALHQQ